MNSHSSLSLVQLGYRLSEDGPRAHEVELAELAAATVQLAPEAAAVLLDRDAPEVLRQRAFLVAASAMTTARERRPAAPSSRAA